jgi:hypothetical protein
VEVMGLQIVLLKKRISIEE